MEIYLDKLDSITQTKYQEFKEKVQELLITYHETDTERFMRFFFSRVLKKQDGSKWEAEELTLLSCL